MEGQARAEKESIRNHINTNSKTNDYRHGQYKITCPSCQKERSKNRTDTPLSVNINSETIVYHCHHCGISGAMPRTQGVNMKAVKVEPKKLKKIVVPPTDKKGKASEWLKTRGISVEVAEMLGCTLTEKNKKPVVGFMFEEDSKTIAVKWRTCNGEKLFWWDNNATKLWGRQVHNDSLPTIESTVVITEGELDALAIKQSFHEKANIDVYSVPNGAPNKITENKIDPSEDGRFKYIWEDRHIFEGVDKIILATDNDKNGEILASELSRRLNKARCYIVDYKGHKDANELLINTDAETVRNQVLNAEPVPLHGLNNIDFYAEEFQSLYDQGHPKGITTGFDSVDKLFSLQTGYLTVVTGYPGDGKSIFLDNIIMNACRNYGWKATYCSFEKPPTLHAVQLAQILVGKPFFEGINNRMTQGEKDYAQKFINEHILFQDYQDGGMPTIESILEKNAQSVMRTGSRILVIDPFNFIQSTGNYALETDMVSDLLTKIQLHCKAYDIHCFFVCHPTKPQVRDGKKNVVTGIDVAKSMSFFSKCDTGLTVYRGEGTVDIHCWKARWQWQSSLGVASLTFNPVNGRYAEAQQVEDDYDWDF
jgi:twinkle protein|tara:strand:- start:4975 stop:6753 length:1779 start_codon:yes stop_codon:yes gene_type:complete